MKKLLVIALIFIVCIININAQANLARGASYVSSYNIYQGALVVPAGFDGNVNTSIDAANVTDCNFVVDLGATYSVYKLVFKWGNNIPYQVRVFNTTDGSGNCLISTLAQSGTQQIVLSPVKNCRYIRVELLPYGQYTFTANLNELEVYSLINSVSGSNFSDNHSPDKAVDRNASTYFQNYYADMWLNVSLSQTVKAVQATVNSDTKNLRVDITGPMGTINAYDYVNSSDPFLIINPDGISSIKISYENNTSVNLYEVSLKEIPIGLISMPFNYDNCGNMCLRTIQYSATKGVEEADTINEQKKPYEDNFSGGKIYVYPIPTKGLLTVDFKNFKADDKVLIELFSVSGQKIMEKRTTTGLIDFDLSNRANGSYILNVKVNSETHKWTIIKE